MDGFPITDRRGTRGGVRFPGASSWKSVLQEGSVQGDRALG